MQRIENGGIDKLYEAGEIGAAARITNVIFVHNVTSRAGQSDACQITQ